MAFTVSALDTSGFSAALLDEPDPWIVFAAALSGNRAAANMVVPFPRGAQFRVRGRTTAAETGTVLDLTAQGVVFLAGFARVVEVEFHVSGNAADETGWAKHMVVVAGGTTPILRVVTVPATGPLQVGGNTLSAVAGAGLAATPAVAAVMVGNNVTLTLTSAEAEILNWVVNVRVHPSVPLILGV